MEVILREPERPKNPVAFTGDVQTTLHIVHNSTGFFDSFHSLRMTADFRAFKMVWHAAR